MLSIFQYGGAVCIITGYWYMVTYPRTSAWCSLSGCILCGIWAAAMMAWGILAIEIFCTALSARNVWNAK